LPASYLCRFGDALGEHVPHTAAATPKRKPALRLAPLTEREIDMLKLLACGLSNLEISTQSHIALSTAKRTSSRGSM
jgi:ATP/maltotriose-dependent transcriptional regulator MalT